MRETKGPRERTLALDGLNAVRRFVREASNYWAFQRAKIQRRMLDADRLAEGEELGTNIL